MAHTDQRVGQAAQCLRESRQLAGPWRTTGDWWREDRWARDEWDVTIESNSKTSALYRIYRELKSETWFVEGNYD